MSVRKVWLADLRTSFQLKIWYAHSKTTSFVSKNFFDLKENRVDLISFSRGYWINYSKGLGAVDFVNKCLKYPILLDSNWDIATFLIPSLFRTLKVEFLDHLIFVVMLKNLEFVSSNLDQLTLLQHPLF